MKTIKRSIALVLAMILTFAMSITVFAETKNADNATFSLTLDNAVVGHTYEAYQILSGDLAENQQTLSNVQWGSGISGNGQTAVIDLAKEQAGIIGYDKPITDASSYAKFLGDDKLTAELLKKQAKTIGANLNTVSGSTTISDDANSKVISGLKPGYYLIKDKDDSISGTDSYTEFILHITNDIKANVKASVPTVEKKVEDKNDTNGISEGWNDSADYDIGDDVPFKLTATLANNIENYNAYKVIFHDTLSDGLTYNENSYSVKLGDKDVTEFFTSSYDASTNTLTFSCDNVLAEGFDAKNSNDIVVTYTAKLNENAIIGSKGNPNKVYLEFSNNPNDNGEGTGTTPEDKVIVFTYKLVVNKIDENNQPLEGAEFTLYKMVKGEKVAVKVVKNDAGTQFTFNGIDDGDYILSETKTPDGYNSISDIKFTVTADHDVISDDPRLNSLSGEAESGAIDLGTSVADGTLTTDVVNHSGSVLPSTGGAGRVAIYVIGAILVIGGGIVLVTKKRVR